MLASYSKHFQRHVQVLHTHALKCQRTLGVATKNSEATLTTKVLLSEENQRRCTECMRGAPNVNVKLPKKKDATYAAVLIALCTDAQGETSVLYTRRSGTLSRHMRQISFPGGLKDSTDEDFVDCALRETEEEIGLPRSRVQIWGTGCMITPPHTAAIVPVMGVVHDLDINELVLNKHEVDEAFTIPVGRLANPSAFHHTQFKSGYSAPIFLVDHYRIWGITGFLTKNFLSCLIPTQPSILRKPTKYVKPYRPS